MFAKGMLGVAAAAVVLAVAGSSLIGDANAYPLLTIVDGAGAGRQPPTTFPCTLNAPGYNECEVAGDAGGTTWPHAQTVNNGSGIPSAAGAWPVGPGFAQDGSLNNALGISGWHASFLNLTEASNVTFQYLGHGDAVNLNEFQVDYGSGWQTLFRTAGSATPNCGAGAGGDPFAFSCTPGINQFTFRFDAGPIPFRYLASIGDVASADTYTNLGDNPDPDTGRGGFFLGADPYAATGAFQNTGTTAYVGLTDRHEIATDHDYQDLGVRISVVPEPGSLALVALGLAALAASTTRRKAAQPLVV